MLKRKYIRQDTITQSQAWNGRYGRESSVLPVHASRTEYDTLGGLNSTRLFLTVAETGKSKIKMPADLVSEKDTPPSLLSRYILSWPREGSGPFHIKTLIPSWSSTLMT